MVFQDVFKNVLQDVFKTFLQDVSKTSSRRLGRWKIVTLKTCWRRLQDTSWRRIEDVSSRPANICWEVTVKLLDSWHSKRQKQNIKKKVKKNEQWEKVKQQLFTFTFLYWKIYIFLENVFGKAYALFANPVTPTPIEILIGFVDVILRSKILDNRLGILM